MKDDPGVFSIRMSRPAWLGALLLCAWAQGAHAHHVMGYATPATALEGLLSGLAHPVIGIDHLLFIAGAGILAARVERGALLPLIFVVASSLAVCARAAGIAAPLGELWVGMSVVLLGAAMLVRRSPGMGVVAALFLLGGAIHGYALAEGIIGAEKTPLFAYLTGLTVIQCLIAYAARAAAGWTTRARPAFPFHRLTGIAVGLAGAVFTVQSVLA